MNKENTNTYKIVFSVALLVLLLWLSIGVTVVAGNTKPRTTQSYQVVEYSISHVEESFKLNTIPENTSVYENVFNYLHKFVSEVKEKEKDGWFVYDINYFIHQVSNYWISVSEIHYKKTTTITL